MINSIKAYIYEKGESIMMIDKKNVLSELDEHIKDIEYDIGEKIQMADLLHEYGKPTEQIEQKKRELTLKLNEALYIKRMIERI